MVWCAAWALGACSRNENPWIYTARSHGDEPQNAGYQVDVDQDGDWDAVLVLIYDKREKLIFAPDGMSEFRQRLTDGFANTNGFEGIRFFVTREHRVRLDRVRGEVESTLGLTIHEAIAVEVLREPHSSRVAEQGLDLDAKALVEAH